MVCAFVVLCLRLFVYICLYIISYCESMLNFDKLESLCKFEKIKRKRKLLDYEAMKYANAAESQCFGSGHSIEDKKVVFDEEERREFKLANRPGVVTVPPSEETFFETEWMPGSTKLGGRDNAFTLYVHKDEGITRKTTAFLLQFRHFYKSSTLSERIFKLNAEKIAELKLKLENLGKM